MPQESNFRAILQYIIIAAPNQETLGHCPPLGSAAYACLSPSVGFPPYRSHRWQNGRAVRTYTLSRAGFVQLTSHCHVILDEVQRLLFSHLLFSVAVELARFATSSLNIFTFFRSLDFDILYTSHDTVRDFLFTRKYFID